MSCCNQSDCGPVEAIVMRFAEHGLEVRVEGRMGHGGTAAHSTLFGARFELPRPAISASTSCACFRRRRVTLNFRKCRFGKSFCRLKALPTDVNPRMIFTGQDQIIASRHPERCAHHVGWRSLRACGRLRCIFAVRPARACEVRGCGIAGKRERCAGKLRSDDCRQDVPRGWCHGGEGSSHKLCSAPILRSF
jgi:hypothetical protein